MFTFATYIVLDRYHIWSSGGKRVKPLNPTLVRSGLVTAAMFQLPLFASSSFQITFYCSSNECTSGNISTLVIKFLYQRYRQSNS
jgi:hypothetical protein